MEAAVQIATLAGIFSMVALNLYTLWRMIGLTAESREARADQRAATLRAEAAAQQSVGHAIRTGAAMMDVRADVKALEVNTNSKMDALLAAKDETAKAQASEANALGEKRGIEIGEARERGTR